MLTIFEMHVVRKICFQIYTPRSIVYLALGIHTIKRQEVNVQKRFKKIINNTEGKTYEKRLIVCSQGHLKKRNRQDLIEVFKMCNCLSRLKLDELFIVDVKVRGTMTNSRN